MPIEPGDLLTLAVHLAGRIDECSQRSATSRAYYAAYHASRRWHAGLPLPGSPIGPMGGVHQQFINRLKNPDPAVLQADRQKSKITGMKLDALRIRRHSADYELAHAIPAKETADQMAQASALLLSL